MIFSSLQFLIFWFFIVIFSQSKISGKPIIIGIVGLVFYSFQGVFNSIVLFYIFLIVCLRNNLKNNLFILIPLILSPLIIIKYSNFLVNEIFKFDIDLIFLDNLVIPPGLSFITFSAIALIIYLKKNSENFDINLSYLYLFPQLIAGPIIKPNHLIPQIKLIKTPVFDDIIFGIFIFSIGIIIKIFLADSFGIYVDLIFSDLSSYNFQDKLFALVLFSQQIFLDFNGYTLMAIGIGKTIGINLPENFDMPYLSKSISEFWRRWHITLSNWIRDYIYIPLGGSRNGIIKNYTNIVIAMFISGLWHGAGFSFIIWGLGHAVFIVLEKFLKDKSSFKIFDSVKILYSYIIVTFLWIFFRINSLSDLNIFFSNFQIYEFFNLKLLYLILLVVILNYLQKYLTLNSLEKIYLKINKYFCISLSITLIIFCIIISKGSSQKFIYFNF